MNNHHESKEREQNHATYYTNRTKRRNYKVKKKERKKQKYTYIQNKVFLFSYCSDTAKTCDLFLVNRRVKKRNIIND